jgi:hypothetical protein
MTLRILLSLLCAALWTLPAAAAERVEMTMYKQPYCGCCDGHADHLRANGFTVNVVQTDDLAGLKKKFGVPQQFEGCHTIMVGGYVVEGHVPATIVRKLLKERPAIRGIALPGMPDGSPGMSGKKTEPFVVYEFSGDHGGAVFATE